MKKFVLAAIAALSLGIGSAYAMQPQVNHLGQQSTGRPTVTIGQRPVTPARRQPPLPPDKIRRGRPKVGPFCFSAPET